MKTHTEVSATKYSRKAPQYRHVPALALPSHEHEDIWPHQHGLLSVAI